MTVVAFSRPFWPLFLHVLSAMLLFGAVLTAFTALLAGHRSVAFRCLLVAVPAWVAMRVCGAWIYSHEKDAYHGAQWLGIGMGIADGGLIVLLLAIGAAYWSQRTSRLLATRTASFLCGVYLLMLAIAWIAMTGKWG